MAMADEELFIPFESSIDPTSAPVQPGEGEVLITPEGTVRGEEGIASALPTPLQAPQPPPRDPMKFFTANVPALDNPETRGMQDDWYERFWKQYSNQNFTNLDDYVDFVTNIQDEDGLLLSTQEIFPYIQKQAMEFMPKEMKQEFQQRIQQAAETSQFEKTKTRLGELNSDPTNKKAGIVYGLKNGQIEMKQVDPNVDFKRKQSMIDGLQKRVDHLDGLRPQRKDYRTTEGTMDNQGFSEDMSEWRELRDEARGAYFEAIGRGVQEDDATAQGTPGAKTPTHTATNPSTGERMQSFDGGESWQPME